jgi:hypothetical protein
MKFVTDKGHLTISLEGIEIVLGLKRRLIIPRDKIVNLSWHSEYSFDQKVWRTAGAGIVNILYAGHFRGAGKRYFLYLHNPHGLSWATGSIITENTLVITLTDYEYSQILVSCPPDIGSRLVDWKQGALSS